MVIIQCYWLSLYQIVSPSATSYISDDNIPDDKVILPSTQYSKFSNLKFSFKMQSCHPFKCHSLQIELDMSSMCKQMIQTLISNIKSLDNILKIDILRIVAFNTIHLKILGYFKFRQFTVSNFGRKLDVVHSSTNISFTIFHDLFNQLWQRFKVVSP